VLLGLFHSAVVCFSVWRRYVGGRGARCDSSDADLQLCALQSLDQPSPCVTPLQSPALSPRHRLTTPHTVPPPVLAPAARVRHRRGVAHQVPVQPLEERPVAAAREHRGRRRAVLAAAAGNDGVHQFVAQSVRQPLQSVAVG